MIRKLKSGEFRLYSRKKDASTGKRRNLGTFSTLEKAKQREREVQYFKKRGLRNDRLHWWAQTSKPAWCGWHPTRHMADQRAIPLREFGDFPPIDKLQA